MLKKILFSTHRILGTILSILFLVWFLSGFVMIYHTFPKVSNNDQLSHMSTLGTDIASDDSVYKSLTDSMMLRLTLKNVNGVATFEFISTTGIHQVPADSSLQDVPKQSFKILEEYAKKWVAAPISRVDTLRELEQWIPFNHLRKDFPIYKFYFDDNEKHQLYIASKTGRVLQFTDKNSRFWAWMGAIPHWIYFTSLRQDAGTWSSVVIWLSGIGCIMCIAGLIVGFWVSIKQSRKARALKMSPYKRFLFKYHHITGYVFGIFVFTFTFSGMMSLADLPQWIVKVHNKEINQQMYFPQPVIIDNYTLSYHKILETYPNRIKSIEWASFGSKPLYKVVIDNQTKVIDASTGTINTLLLQESDIRNYISSIHSEAINISLMNETDNYYIGHSNQSDSYPLPVYKTQVDDADQSTYYINPKDGNVRYFNNNTKAHKWMYQGMHSYKIKFLEDRPLLWNIVMWLTMIGGTLVSLSGVCLGFKYLKRKFKKKLYHTNNKL